MSAILKTILEKLKTTSLNHKKKLIALTILIAAGYLAKKKLKLNHIVSLVMFCFKIFSKILGYLPLPTFSNYRTMLPFKYQPQTFHEFLPKVMNVENIMKKIKNKEKGSLNQLKVSVLSGTILSIIIYNAESLYQLIKDKYIADFSELGADQLFQRAIQSLKRAFADSLSLLKEMLSQKIHEQISSFDTNAVVGIQELDDLFSKAIELSFQQTECQQEKVHAKYSVKHKSLSFKRADNYFKTTKEFVDTKKKSSFGWIGNIFSTIFPSPVEQVTQQRYFIHQILYTLTLKKHRDFTEWPNPQSHHLYELVIEECYQLMISTNFCMVSYKNALLNKQIFMNRVRIFFVKRAKSEKKRLLELLPIFYKIVQEQLCDPMKRQMLYERELTNTLRDVEFQVKDVGQIWLRNRILNQIYLSNEFQFINKDFQLKYFNERDGIEIKPTKTNSKVLEDEDDVEDMLKMFEKSKKQGKEPQLKTSNLMKDILG